MRVLISGAGIAGLTVAYWLRRYGFTPTIVERAPSLLTGGYLEVKDNRGVDGTDILKDIAFLKFDGDGTIISAPGRELTGPTWWQGRSVDAPQ